MRKHRSNPQSKTLEDYFRRTLYVSYLVSLIPFEVSFFGLQQRVFHNL